MARVGVLDDRGAIAHLVVDRLRQSRIVESCQYIPTVAETEFASVVDHWKTNLEIDTIIYSPSLVSRKQWTPDIVKAENILRPLALAAFPKVILLSNAAFYSPSNHNPGLISGTEVLTRGGKNLIAREWARLESLATQHLKHDSATKLTILRPATTPAPGGQDFFSQLFQSRLAITLPGHDPSIQLLSAEDLASAICKCVEMPEGGVFNIAPSCVIPLRAALRLSGTRRIPVSRLIQRIFRGLLVPLGASRSIDHLEYIRYSWTISGKKFAQETGFTPQQSSAEVLESFLRETRPKRPTRAISVAPRNYDDFGMDKDYIAAYGRTLLKFLSRYYWRVEVEGLDHVPSQGRGVLVGTHRGFMPWDGVIALHTIVNGIGRYPRFLIHPSLVKFPFLFNFMTKLGGIVASQENAGNVLTRDELLGVYPEGIRGAFSLYRNAYRLQNFGQDRFVKIALRGRAPIIPFVTVGSAEIFPILGRIDWNWWKRQTEWPFFPLTPTFPLLPVPLPSKWHTQFLPPLHVEEQYPPEAADDPVIVRQISQKVRQTMQQAIEEIHKRRRSIFFGSVFTPKQNEAAKSQP